MRWKKVSTQLKQAYWNCRCEEMQSGKSTFQRAPGFKTRSGTARNFNRVAVIVFVFVWQVTGQSRET